MKLKVMIALMVTFLMSFNLLAEQVQLNMSASHPLLPAEQKNHTFIKVSLTGFKMSEADRPPVNLALVLDKSGSMSGAKIVKAKQAAIDAVKRLGKDDIISVILYDSSVEVLVPATKLNDKQAIISKIREVQASGGTALFAGVSKGAAEVRKFLNRKSVNRVILLSDGQANEGPSTPEALGELGASLIKEGISVSTIGLGQGYNEDLMARLATKSDGNHIYASTPEQLIAAFNNEFGDVLTVVAQEVSIKIICGNGVRPVQVLGREAEINGSAVILNMNQLYSDQEKFIILEVEINAAERDSTSEIASAEVSYANMQTHVTDTLSSRLSVRFSVDKQKIGQSTDHKTLASCISIKASIANSRAIQLRDEGKIQEARAILTSNGLMLNDQMGNVKDPALLNRLRVQQDNNLIDLKYIEDDKNWSNSRKQMLYYNRANVYQQKDSENSYVTEEEKTKK